MNERGYERIDVSVNAHICCEPYRYQSTITNMSEKGVCIHTAMCFPIETQCKLFISGNDGWLEEQAFVKHITKTDGFHDSMGLELLNPSRQYREFVNTLEGAS
jgi:hypothetical protein